MHKVLDSRLVKLAQEKVCLGDHLGMTIVVDWDVNPQTI